jgi:hypothetical protein
VGVRARARVDEKLGRHDEDAEEQGVDGGSEEGGENATELKRLSFVLLSSCAGTADSLAKGNTGTPGRVMFKPPTCSTSPLIVWATDAKQPAS